MNNRKYLIASSIILILSTIIYIIFANIFSLSTKNDGLNDSLFTADIDAYKWVIRSLSLIPFVVLLIVWFAKRKFIHTYGIHKRSIQNNIYYSVVIFIIELILLILMFMLDDIIKLAIISWVSVGLFGVYAYLEGSLTYKLYFY